MCSFFELSGSRGCRGEIAWSIGVGAGPAGSVLAGPLFRWFNEIHYRYLRTHCYRRRAIRMCLLQPDHFKCLSYAPVEVVLFKYSLCTSTTLIKFFSVSSVLFQPHHSILRTCHISTSTKYISSLMHTNMGWCKRCCSCLVALWEVHHYVHMFSFDDFFCTRRTYRL